MLIVDDVLNSGKHFKVAQKLMSAQFPDVELRGLFLARCIRDAPLADFPEVDALADRNDQEFFSRLSGKEREALVATLKKLVAVHGLKGMPTT